MLIVPPRSVKCYQSRLVISLLVPVYYLYRYPSVRLCMSTCICTRLHIYFLSWLMCCFFMFNTIYLNATIIHYWYFNQYAQTVSTVYPITKAIDECVTFIIGLFTGGVCAPEWASGPVVQLWPHGLRFFPHGPRPVLHFYWHPAESPTGLFQLWGLLLHEHHRYWRQGV